MVYFNPRAKLVSSNNICFVFFCHLKEHLLYIVRFESPTLQVVIKILE